MKRHFVRMLLIGLVPLSLVVLVAGALVLGSRRWQARTQALLVRLEQTGAPVSPATVDFRELETLPAPVQRYLGAVLRNGQDVIARAELRHAGTFNTSETGEQWRRFTSHQAVVTRRPGFVWNGRIAMLPGVPVRVHDAYVAGDGILYAAVLGLLPVADAPRSSALAEGELMRFLAEAVWYPTALLPSQGVQWEPVDERAARATLADGSHRVTLLFTFGPDGYVESVSAAARGRMVGDAIETAPWHGRFRDYAERGGMRIPLEGEVAWLLPGGPAPYWRGRITDVAFTPAR